MASEAAVDKYLSFNIHTYISILLNLILTQLPLLIVTHIILFIKNSTL